MVKEFWRMRPLGSILWGRLRMAQSTVLENFVARMGSSMKAFFKDGLEHDERAVETWPDGGKFTGRFQRGEKVGHGEMLWENGSSFSGEWKFSKPHGMGLFKRHEGGGKYSTYNGEWSQGRQNGNGIMTCTDGSYYKGPWIAGKFDTSAIKNARGEHKGADGSMFRGEFRQGLPHGKGIKTFADGATLKGTFIAAAPEATATGNLQNGLESYKGEYRGGERAGKGELHAQSGEHYNGEFYADKYHGEGVLTGADGDFNSVFSGTFKDGLLHGEGHMRWDDGSYYIGAMRKGQAHGFGKFHFRNGRVFEGRSFLPLTRKPRTSLPLTAKES